MVKQCLPCLAQLVRHTDKEVLADACWALSYLIEYKYLKFEIEFALARTEFLLPSDSSLIVKTIQVIDTD